MAGSDDLANEINTLARRHRKAAQLVVQVGEVVQTDPLQVELHGADITLDDEILNRSQEIRRYEADDQPEIGDLMVVTKHFEEWRVVAIFSESKDPKTISAVEDRVQALEDAPPGGGSETIQDENTDLPIRAKLSFQGAQVAATDDAPNNRTVVTITAAAPAHAGVATEGTTKLSTAPANPVNPIAVGDNDPRNTNARNPNPASVTDASVAGGAAIAESKLALASDGPAGTPTRRSLGLTASQAMPGNTKLDQIAAPVGPVSFGGWRAANAGTPTAASDLTTKQYVDALAAGYQQHAAVRAASVVNQALGAQASRTIDGVAMASGQRALLKAQTTTSENGLYVVNADFSLTRAADGTQGNLSAGATVWVNEGTQGDTAWTLITDDPITIGTTGQTWTQSSALGQIIAGAGLTKSGATLDIGAGAGISVGADTIAVLFGTAAGTAAQGNDSRIVGAFQAATALGGDLSGTLPNPTVAKASGASGLLLNDTRLKRDSAGVLVVRDAADANYNDFAARIVQGLTGLFIPSKTANAGGTTPEVWQDSASGQLKYRDTINGVDRVLNRQYMETIPAVRATRATTLGLGTGNVAVALDKNDYDTNGIHSTVTNTTRFVCQTPGIYTIQGGISINANTGFYCVIRLNGTTEYGNNQNPTTGNQTVSTTLKLAVGDYVELVYNGAAATLNASEDVFLAMTWVGGPGPTVTEVGIPSVKATSTTAVAGSGANPTVLLMATEQHDTDQMHDTAANTSRLTCKTPGVYSIKGEIRPSATPPGPYKLVVRLNGTTVIAESSPDSNAVGGYNSTVVFATDMKLAANDYVELLVWNSNAAGFTAGSTFSMTLLATGKTVIPRARVTRNAAQTIQANVGTKVLLDGIINGEDNDAIFDAVNNRFVIKTAGTYAISGQVTFGTGSGDYRSADILVNGAYKSTNGGVYASATYGQRLQVGIAAIDLKVGDVVELYCQQNTSAGTGLGISTGEGNTWLALAKYGMSGGGGGNEPGWAQSGNDIYNTNSGSVRIGGSAGPRAVGATAEDLKMVRGVVNADGTIAKGSGFTVSRTATGKYTITFTTAFSTEPAVSLGIWANASNAGNLITISDAAGAKDATKFGVYCLNPGSTAFIDNKFEFIAVGPR